MVQHPVVRKDHALSAHEAGSPAVVHLGLTLQGLKKLAVRIQRMCEEGPERRFKVGFDELTTTEFVYRCDGVMV
jgi:hypothetical protein